MNGLLKMILGFIVIGSIAIMILLAANAGDFLFKDDRVITSCVLIHDERVCSEIPKNVSTKFTPPIDDMDRRIDVFTSRELAEAIINESLQ